MISSILGYTEGIYGTSLVYAVPLVMMAETVRSSSISRKVFYSSVYISVVILLMYFVHYESWSLKSTTFVVKYIIGILLIGSSAFYMNLRLLERKMKMLLLILFVSCLPLFFVDKYELLLFTGAIHKKSGLMGMSEMRGLLWNSNYLSICGALLGGYFLGKIGLFNKWFFLSCCVSILGGSRSGILILFLLATIEVKSLRFFVILCSLWILSSNYNTALSLFEIFSERGLTGREYLFENALILIQQNTWTGVGYNYGDILLEMGSFTSTVQNTVLSNALKYGVIFSFFEFTISIVVLLKLFQRRDEFRYVLLVIIIDSLLRTYSFGGIGLLSYFYTFIILREINLKKNTLYA